VSVILGRELEVLRRKGRRRIPSVVAEEARRVEYERLTAVWLPLLAAALGQPSPSIELQRECNRILRHLPLHQQRRLLRGEA
jgi:hypothetical protein